MKINTLDNNKSQNIPTPTHPVITGETSQPVNHHIDSFNFIQF